MFHMLALLAALATPARAYDSFRQECPNEVTYADPFVADPSLAQVKARIETTLAAQGLAVRWAGSVGQPFEAADLARLKRLGTTVLPGLAKYPRAWFEHVGLKSIALVRDLRVNDELRKAMPDPEHDTVYYADNDDLICAAGMEERVHHEFYHFIEAKVNGSEWFQDPAWMKINPPGFEYGTGGDAAYHMGPDWQNLGHPAEAFVSAYAQLAPEEDKAEVFGWMMADGYKSRLLAWTQADARLASKRGLLLDLIKPYFTPVR